MTVNTVSSNCTVNSSPSKSTTSVITTGIDTLPPAKATVSGMDAICPKSIEANTPKIVSNLHNAIYYSTYKV